MNNIKPFLIGGFSTSFNLASNEDNPEDNASRTHSDRPVVILIMSWDLESIFIFIILNLLPQFGVFLGLNDQLVRDKNPNSGWTKNIEKMSSRGVFINFTIQ